MYAVFTVVTFTSGTSEEEARKGLESELIPAIKQAPGFINGVWFGDDQQGHGLVLFDTEEQAQQAVQTIGSGSNAVGAPVASSKVYPVRAQA